MLCYSSPHRPIRQMEVLQEVRCAVVCPRTELSEQESNQFVEKIADDYTAHM